MIGTYNESSLHNELKKMFCPKTGKMEQDILGSVCDILCKNKKIIEIQTANLTKLRTKLEKFLIEYKTEIVYPISINTFVKLLNEDGTEKRIRKSPKHGNFFQVFREIIGLYHLAENKNLNLTLVFIESEVTKIDDKKGRSRFKNPRIIDKKLIKIIEIQKFKTLNALCKSVLKKLPQQFTNKDLANMGAGKHASYTSLFLKKTGFIKQKGKEGRFILYTKI